MRVIVLKGKVQQHLKITESVCCSDDANFELMVIKHAEETSNCIAAWKFCHKTEYTLEEKKKEPLLETANATQKAFCGLKQGHFNATDEKVLVRQ